MKTPQRNDVPVCYIDGRILLTDKDAWTYLIIPPVSWAFLSSAENEQQITSTAGAYANLRTPEVDMPRLAAWWEAAKSSNIAPVAELHIRTVARRYSMQSWAEQFVKNVPRTTGFQQHMVRVLSVIQGKAYWEKITYLGVRLGPRALNSPPNPTDVEIEKWRALANSAGLTLGSSELHARHSDAAETAWLIRHIAHGSKRDMARIPLRNAYGPDDISALMDVTLREKKTHLSRITAETTEHVIVLTFAGFPKVMTYPNGGPPWAALADWSSSPAFPVEYSGRITLMDPQQVDKDIRHKLTSIDEEAEHTSSAGARIPLVLQERMGDAQLLQHALATSGDPLAYATHRLIITGPTADICRARARAVIEYCNRTGLRIVAQTCDQLPLFLESFPGGKPRGKLHIQQQPVSTIAGGMPQAAEQLGDSIGPYLGTAMTQAESPVHWSPFEAAKRDDPTVAAILGEPGGGKSYLTGRICLDAAVTGNATVVIIDPIKREMAQLAPLIRRAESPVNVIAIDESHPGLLDPFGFTGTMGEKIQRASEVLMMLLSDTEASPAKTSRNGAILRAVELTAAKPNPSLRKVVEELEAEAINRAGDGSRIEENLVSELGALSRMPLGSLCFAKGGTETLNLIGQTTILTFNGLDLPSSTANPGSYRMAERLSIALYYLATELVRGLFSADRSVRKLLAVDEAWALTRTPQGQSLIEAMSRMGRSHNIALLMASHNVQDLLDERITGCISSVFAVHSRADKEVRAVFSQLEIEDTPANRTRLGDLKTGQVIMRDLDGRIGVVQIDDGGPEFRQGMDTNPTRSFQSPPPNTAHNGPPPVSSALEHAS